MGNIISTAHSGKRSKSEELKPLQLSLNEQLCGVMKNELKFEELKNKLLNDKKFIAAVVEEVRKAA